MRVLLTSIGRRSYLAGYFREALGAADELWGADESPFSAALYGCDQAVLLGEPGQPGYVQELLGLCRRCRIDVLVPLGRSELQALAAQRQQFEEAGVLLAVCPAKTVQIACDRYLTHEFARRNGLGTPPTVLNVEEALGAIQAGRMRWPLLVRPRKPATDHRGARCDNPAELHAAVQQCPGAMIQQFLAGQVYGLDLFGDRQHRLISVFARQRLGPRGGETDQAVSSAEPNMIAFGRKLGEALEIFGPLEADVAIGTEGPALLEINPRFGGGYPCSHLAGADFPRKLLRIRQGRTLLPDIGCCKSGQVMMKQEQVIGRDLRQVESLKSRAEDGSTGRLDLLFTSAGRRVALLRLFRKAAYELGVGLRIHAVDCQPLAPALQMADEASLAPPVSSKQYLAFLLEYCRANRVSAVIPLLDWELQLLADTREQFAAIGTRVIVSGAQTVRICRDKELTSRFLLEHGFRAPRVLCGAELEAAGFPLFVKPRAGSSSIGARKVANREELDYLRANSPDLLVMDFITGKEYTVDVFTDFGGKPLSAVPRLRYETRAGEISKGKTCKNERIVQENFRLMKVLGDVQGMITTQCFLVGEQVVFFEINPRFGGGCPLSIRAGADSPRWLLELLLGRQPVYSQNGWQDGLWMLRFDEDIFASSQDLPGAPPE